MDDLSDTAIDRWRDSTLRSLTAEPCIIDVLEPLSHSRWPDSRIDIVTTAATEKRSDDNSNDKDIENENDKSSYATRRSTAKGCLSRNPANVNDLAFHDEASAVSV